MKKILYLPLDERPCNYYLPYLVSRIAKGYELVRPLKSEMGLMKKPSPFNKIKNFVVNKSKDCDYAIISLEQLLYGSLCYSRIHHFTEDELRERMDLIRVIKENNPSLKIYLFSLVLRCPCYNTNEEEPLYYGKCGGDIFNYGVLLSKKFMGLISENEFKTQSEPLLKHIGKNLSDFEHRRKINRNMIELFIREYSKYVDMYVIPQDDSEPFGYAMMDRQYLDGVLKETGVKASIYPGSDELGMALLSRVISDDLNIHPEVMAVYPKEKCKKMVPMYESYPIHETFQKQLETTGFRLVEKSDNVIYMNYPTEACVNMGSKPNASYADRDMPNFVNKIVNDVKAGKKVMLCDGAYGNGGEEDFLKAVLNEVSLFDLYAYAGWNTSSNTLGTVLCEGMLNIIFGLSKASKMFICERVIEDIGYCGHVRWDIWHEYAPQHGYSLENAGCQNGIVAKQIKKDLIKYIESDFNEVHRTVKINKCQLPWSRLFEVDLGLHFKKD